MDEVENLKRFITSLRAEHATEIEAERRRTRAAEFDAEVARWAAIGVARSAVRLTVGHAGMPVSDALALGEALGRNAAAELLDRAKLAFKDRAEHYRALKHIQYMETHAGGRGVQFTPFYRSEADAIPAEWDWPKTALSAGVGKGSGQ